MCSDDLPPAFPKVYHPCTCKTGHNYQENWSIQFMWCWVYCKYKYIMLNKSISYTKKVCRIMNASVTDFENQIPLFSNIYLLCDLFLCFWTFHFTVSYLNSFWWVLWWGIKYFWYQHFNIVNLQHDQHFFTCMAYQLDSRS